MLYTSGSTGTPKGVAMPHSAIANLVRWQNTVPGLSSPARVVQYTPLTFDVSFQEIFTTLAAGGTLLPIDDLDRRDREFLLRFLRDKSVERLFLPFVALQHLAEAAAAGLPERLRDVITAGEQLRVTPAIRSCFKQSRSRLHNHYGPTETHVVTAYTLTADVDTWETLPSIGNPIANVRVRVLDSSQRLSRRNSRRTVLRRSSPRRGIFPSAGFDGPKIRRHTRSSAAFTVPATSRNGTTALPRARWSSWAASTARSKSGATEWNCRKSRLCCPTTPP